MGGGMKLLRFGPAGAEKPGVLLEDGGVADVSGYCADFDEAFFAAGRMNHLEAWVKNAPVLPPENLRLGPAVARPSKIVCVGLNYREHARETGAEIPKEPVLFMKATSAWSGPFDDVVIPPGSVKTDWEVELALVIGKVTRRVSPAEAKDCVAGYAVMNDYSEREFQKERGGQWMKGKGCDTFAPFGPWLVTPDEAGDPDNLELSLTVNGETRQRGATADMIFPVAEIVSYISRFMTLLPGDVVSTGTPPGVGAGMKPPVFLKPGDVVEATVRNLGVQRQRVVAAEH